MPKAEIVAQGYDLSLNRYKEVVHEEIEHISPKNIIAELKTLEDEIQQGLDRAGEDGGMRILALWRSVAQIYSGGTPSRSKQDFYGGGIPWAKISDIEASQGLLNTDGRVPLPKLV